MAQYELKFMYDWGSGVCVWSANAAAKKHFGDYPINTASLPISKELVDVLDNLIAQYDTALNWNNPGGALLWDKTQQAKFEEDARSAYKQLCIELGAEYKVSFYPVLF